MPGEDQSRRRKDPLLRCRNCAEPLRGLFCSDCGQSHEYPRLEFGALLEDRLDRVRRLDTKLLRTLADLTFTPARVCREYIDGRRIRYVNPLAYALATFALVFAVAQLSMQLHGGPEDPRVAALLSWGPLLNLLALPLLAALMIPAFAGAPRKANWLEHFVVVLFSVGHVALLQALLIPLVSRSGSAGVFAVELLPIVWLSSAGVGVYRTSTPSTIVRVVIAFALMQVVVVGVLAALVGT